MYCCFIRLVSSADWVVKSVDLVVGCVGWADDPDKNDESNAPDIPDSCADDSID